MKCEAVLRCWIAGLSLAVLGCSADGGEPRLTAKAEAPERPPVAVEVLPVAGRELVEGVDVVGTLAPKYEALVKSEIPGRIAEVYVTQWVRVTKGQPLARVDVSELEVSLQKAKAGLEAIRASEESAKAALLEAKLSADRSQREYERLLKLKEVGLVTQQSLDDGLTARDASRARISAAEAQISATRAQTGAAEEDVRQIQTRLAKAVIRSPLAGVVSQRNVNLGDMPGDAVAFRIVDNAVLDLTVSVPSRDTSKLAPGQPLSFATEALPGETFTGKVMFINPSADAADRSVKVNAEVRNSPEKLKGGLFVKGRIITGQRKDVLQVPRAALLTWDAGSAQGDLFIVEKDVARRRVVRTGAVLGDLIEVESGLAPGESVVTRGGFNLKDGDRVLVAQPKGGA